jgi:hypothetical protein
MIFSKTEAGFDWNPMIEGDDPEAILSVELVRHVLSLPDEARAKLLAFFHSVEDGMQADASLQTAWPGEMTLTLFKRKAEPEDPPHAAGNVVVLRR